MFEIKKNEIHIKFEYIFTDFKNHNDHLHFGFLDFLNIKTYCYISESQIKYLHTNFKDYFSHNPNIFINNKRSNYKNYNDSIDEKFIFNISLIVLSLKEENKYNLELIKNNLNKIKKNNLLSLIFDDKRELFHNIKNKITINDINNFNFSDFSFNNKNCNYENSICFKAKDIKSLTELSEFVFKYSNKETVKNIINIIILKKDNKFSFDYKKIRYIWFLQKLMNNEEVFHFIKNYESDYIKTELFQEILWIHDNKLEGVVLLFKEIKNINSKYRVLKKWDMEDHILKSFTEVMKKAYPKLKPRVENIDSILYFYHNLSRDYGRTFLENFKTNIKSTYINIFNYIKTNNKYKNYEFYVPQNYHEMIKIGSELHNCAGNFDQIEFYKKVLPICIKKNGQNAFYLSLKDYGVLTAKAPAEFEFGQLAGYKNGLVSDIDYNNIKEFFNKLSQDLNIKIDDDNIETK